MSTVVAVVILAGVVVVCAASVWWSLRNPGSRRPPFGRW